MAFFRNFYLAYIYIYTNKIKWCNHNYRPAYSKVQQLLDLWWWWCHNRVTFIYLFIFQISHKRAVNENSAMNHTDLLLLGIVHTMFQVAYSAEWKGERIPGASEELHSYQTKTHQRPGGQICTCSYRLLTFFSPILKWTQYLPLNNCFWTASSIWEKVLARGSQKVWP